MNLLTIIIYLGTFVFAVTGALKARVFKMDIFGASVLAFVTAYGGGTLRDLLIGIQPVNWINDRIALLLVIAGTVCTYFIKETKDRLNRAILFFDAIGLGAFTATGIQTSLNHNLHYMYALIMGVITATFGGLIADVLCSTIPGILKRGELYATACAIGGIVYVLLDYFDFKHDSNLLICLLIIVAIRIYVKRKDLKLPGI